MSFHRIGVGIQPAPVPATPVPPKEQAKPAEQPKTDETAPKKK